MDYITFGDNRPGAVIGSYQHIFDYDDSLRRISCENQLDDVLCTYVYNDRGLMESETIDFDTVSGDNPTFQTKYEYDDMGRVSKIEYPTIDTESRSVSYAYTDRGELDTVHYPAPANEVENRAYDPGGRLVGIDRPAVDETRDYDNANRVSWIDNLGIGRLNYGYDDNGNKTSETWANVPTTVSNWDFNISSYDAEDRFMDFQRSAAFNATTNVSFNRTNAGKSIGNIQSITEQQGDLGLELSGSRALTSTHELLDAGDDATNNQVYNVEGQLTTSHTSMNLSWNAAGLLDGVQVQGTEGGVYRYGYDAMDAGSGVRKKARTIEPYLSTVVPT